MRLKLLDAKNPVHETWAGIWDECEALYKGGAWIDQRIHKFLPQNPAEPTDVYGQRTREAAYTSYLGPIVDYFVSWLYSGDFQLKARDVADRKAAESVPTPAGYTEFIADVGGDTSLNQFIRERTTDAMVKQCSHWLIELPAIDAETAGRMQRQEMAKLEYDEAALGVPTLCKIDREQVYDWSLDEHGKLQWVIIHDLHEIRNDPREQNREMVRETWRLYDKTTVETFALEYPKNQRPKDPEFDVPSEGVLIHRFKEIPLISLHVGDGLWIGERTRKAQIEHFRLNSAKSWLIRRTCYAMPIIKSDDPEAGTKTMGAGYALMLSKDDSFEWTSPANTPFDVIQKSIDAQRDEIYRIVHQMAQGLDNNADTVGRSADSKQIDTAATRIMLNAYGSVVRKALEETFEILSDALGDVNIFWSVEGFNGYDTATAGELIANATAAQLLGIPSKTFRKLIKTKAALALIPEANPGQRESIITEVSESIDQMPDLEELTLPVEEDGKIEVAKIKADTAKQIARDKAKADAAKPPPAKKKPVV